MAFTNTFSGFILVVCIMIKSHVLGDHFRGGTISWKSTGTGFEVELQVKLGWRHGSSISQCDSSNINQFVEMSDFKVQCTSGCPGSPILNTKPYGITCLAADQQQEWARSEHIFTYTFSNEGPFTVGYSSCCWINALGGTSLKWNVATTIDLHVRSDTGFPNQSPVAGSKPVYYIKYGCDGDITIPVSDADGDNVKCRWATGNECAGVCYSTASVPNVQLDGDNCILHIQATAKADGMYAIALTIEDRPQSTITVGGNTKTPNDVLSSIPMQFIVVTPDIKGRSCSDKPEFVTPTPATTDLLVSKAGDTLHIGVYATSKGAQITSFTLIDPPSAMQQTSISQDSARSGVYYTNISWKPTAADKGLVTLCVEATDTYLISSTRCLTIKAWDVSPCESDPCFFNGTCTRRDYTEEFDCACVPGYTSRQCHINIDECSSDPCQNGGTCFDLVNGYECVCAPGYTDSDCQTDIDECASNPCFNGATCFDLIDEWFCGCAYGYTDINCATDIDECNTQPCENGGTCRDLVGISVCDCIPGTSGIICQNVLLQFATRASADHFRGGTINWHPTGNGNEVKFNVKLGWNYQGGYCDDTLINQFVSMSSFEMKCTSGCSSNITLNSNPHGYTCVAADNQQQWGRAEHSFTYTFPDKGPFVVGYTSGAWIQDVGGGSWTIQTTVDLHIRSDTGTPNHSPITGSKPVYYIKYGCNGEIRIPISDEDGDNIKCRWATGPECNDVCFSSGAVPNARLDEDTCTLHITATDKKDGLYAVALTIEDTPHTDTNVGGTPYSSTDVLSSIPMQFIVKTPDIPGRTCSDKPNFVTPTPLTTDLLVSKAGDTIKIPIYATSRGAKITSFTMIDPPSGIQQASMDQDSARNGVYFTDLSWKPTAADKGIITLCVEATDSYLVSSQRCLTIKAWDRSPCESDPCFFNGTCTRQNFTEKFDCACAPGYTSRQCHIDINECSSDPCQNGGTCFDLLNGYECICVAGYTDSDCQTDIDECASNPCLNGATCFDLIDEWFCGCVDGYTDQNCATDIDECYTKPCENGGTCTDLVGTSTCDCIPGTSGVICQNGLDHCLSIPCQNDGTCIHNETTGYVCDCVNGWLGKNCAFRFENSTFGNTSVMENEYMRYSDCNCQMGNGRQELCYTYTLGRSAGFGITGVFLGIASGIGLYLLYLWLIGLDEVRNKESNIIHPKEEEVDMEQEEKPVETVTRDKKPVGRQHKCWACDVKRNLSQPPVWYRQEYRKYPNRHAETKYIIKDKHA